MEFKIILFLYVIALGFLIIIFRLIKKSMVTPSSALLWILLGLIMLSIPLLYNQYKALANLIGFADATNLVYIFIIGYLLIYSLYLSVRLKKSSDRIQIMISSLAVLEAKVKKIEKNED